MGPVTNALARPFSGTVRASARAHSCGPQGCQPAISTRLATGPRPFHAAPCLISSHLHLESNTLLHGNCGAPTTLFRLNNNEAAPFHSHESRYSA